MRTVSIALLALIAGVAGAQWLSVVGGAQTCCTYYIDNAGSDSANGRTPATAWQTVAKVNAATLSAGQSVGFKAGGTWREQLTPGQSGSAGNPITFTSYGSGAQPIINGSNLVSSSWTQLQVTQFSDSMNHNGTCSPWTCTGSGVSFASSELQVTTTTSGSHRASDNYSATPPSELWLYYSVNYPSLSTCSGDCLISGLYNSGNGNPVASVGVHNSAGTLYWTGYYSDTASTYGSTVSSLAVTAATVHTILVHAVSAAGTGSFTYYIDGTQEGTVTGMTNNTSGYLPTQILLGENYQGGAVTETAYYTSVSIYSGTNDANLWQISLATQPYILILNGTTVAPAYTGVPGPATPDESWYWTSSTLSIQSTSQPQSRFSTIEAGARAYGANLGGISYVTLNGLDFRKGNSTANGAIALAVSSAHDIITNCGFEYNAGAGVWLSTNSGGDILISNNSFTHNAYAIGSYQFAGAASGHEVLIQNNTIANNDYLSPANYFPEALHLYGNYFIVQNNALANNGNVGGDTIGIHILNGASQSYGQHNIVRYNTITGQVSNGANDGSGIETDNYSSYNQIGPGNVIWANNGPCIDIYASNNEQVYNNTCYGNGTVNAPNIPKAEISLIDDTGVGTNVNIVVENNIGFATQSYTVPIWVGPHVTGASGLSINHNLWYGSGQSNWYQWSGSVSSPVYGSVLATWNALTGVSGDLNANPSLTSPPSNVTLQSGSPAINAGVCISGVTTCPTNIGAK